MIGFQVAGWLVNWVGCDAFSGGGGRTVSVAVSQYLSLFTSSREGPMITCGVSLFGFALVVQASGSSSGAAAAI